MKKRTTTQETGILRWNTMLGHTYFRGELRPDGTLERVKSMCCSLADATRQDKYDPEPWDPTKMAAYQWDGKKFWRRA